MFWNKKPSSDTKQAPANEPRDFVLEAERILQKPDMISMAAGIRPTSQPLREMLKSDDVDVVNDAVNTLATLLQGPNGLYRKIAALAFGQLGLAFPPILEFLHDRVQNDPAPDVQRALNASLFVLESKPEGASELERRRRIQSFYEGALGPDRNI